METTERGQICQSCKVAFSKNWNCDCTKRCPLCDTVLELHNKEYLCFRCYNAFIAYKSDLLRLLSFRCEFCNKEDYLTINLGSSEAFRVCKDCLQAKASFYFRGRRIEVLGGLEVLVGVVRRTPGGVANAYREAFIWDSNPVICEVSDD